MSTVAYWVERLKEMNPEEHVAVAFWTRPDVEETAAEMGIKLTDEQVDNVLDEIERKHDAELGISWDTVRCYVEEEGRSVKV